MSARFSEDGQYRYSLLRDLGLLSSALDGAPRTVTFVMLNPSTADATTDDPTIRRCLGFARTWGYGILQVVNLYAYRATNPRDLWKATDPVGPGNDNALTQAFRRSDLNVAAWGAHARRDRVQEFLDRFVPRFEFHALGVTLQYHPRHPLYVRADAGLFPYNGEPT